MISRVCVCNFLAINGFFVNLVLHMIEKALWIWCALYFYFAVENVRAYRIICARLTNTHLLVCLHAYHYYFEQQQQQQQNVNASIQACTLHTQHCLCVQIERLNSTKQSVCIKWLVQDICKYLNTFMTIMRFAVAVVIFVILLSVCVCFFCLLCACAYQPNSVRYWSNRKQGSIPIDSFYFIAVLFHSLFLPHFLLLFCLNVALHFPISWERHFQKTIF